MIPSRIVDLFIEIIGAGVGVFLACARALGADRIVEGRRHGSHIDDISPILREEMRTNYRLAKTLESNIASFWTGRPLFRSEYIETYKEELFRWSVENEGHFPRMLTNINELNSYILRYGDNPSFKGTLLNLAYMLSDIIARAASGILRLPPSMVKRNIPSWFTVQYHLCHHLERARKLTKARAMKVQKRVWGFCPRIVWSVVVYSSTCHSCT